MAATSPSVVRARFRAARTEAALTGTGTALIGAGVGLAALLTWLAEGRGMLQPETWPLALGGGAVVLAIKAALDLLDRDDDADLWRHVLTQAFGDDMRSDGDVARQARLAIEFRTRLAAAEAKAGRTARHSVNLLMLRIDHFMDCIVDLARQTAIERGESRFQTGLSSRSGQRLSQIESQVTTAHDPAHARRLQDAANGLSSHVRAVDGLARRVEDSYLRLERAVAALGAVTSEIILDLSRGRTVPQAGALDAQIAGEILRIRSELHEGVSALAPPLP
ncbi:MAG: hypothetical protein NTX73_01985 [Rhodobacterales bacterium]|nr:hypothetical protein [Rhodobacterales bacterium]